MEKCFLTNGGNLLRFHPTERFYFQKPNGEFIREVSNNEAEFLCQNCLEVDVHHPNEHPEFLPTWHFIKSVRVLDDYSNFREETSCNGGDYSFHTSHDWYVAKYPNGEWKFAYVENYSTSAEFGYDELAGRFESNLEVLNLSNVVAGQVGMYTTREGGEEMLEKIGNIGNFSDLWNEVYKYIPSRWDDEDKEYTQPSSVSYKKEIITRLKELGVEKMKPSTRGRVNRGGRR